MEEAFAKVVSQFPRTFPPPHSYFNLYCKEYCLSSKIPQLLLSLKKYIKSKILKGPTVWTQDTHSNVFFSDVPAHSPSHFALAKRLLSTVSSAFLYQENSNT